MSEAVNLYAAKTNLSKLAERAAALLAAASG
jgi:hypothetical protein